MAKKISRFASARKAARIEAAQKAARDAEIRKFRDFFIEVLHMTPQEALAEANRVCGK